MQDETEFITLIKTHKGILFKVSNIYSDDYEDQKDLYQEIVFQLWKSFGTFRGESKISTWIYRIALNTSITHIRKKKRIGQQVAFDFELLNRADEQDTLIEEQMKILNAHIGKLSVVEKGLIILHLDGKNYEEIASITGFTATNVGTRLFRIKQKLKTQING